MAEQTLKEKTAKGLFWGGLSNGVQQLLGLLFGIFLARLLTPGDYGMVGMLAIFSALAAILQDSGFAIALINQKEVRHEDYNSVFWFNIAIAIICYIVLFFCAPLIARFFHKPELVQIARWSFLGFVISSLGTSQNAYLLKNLMIRERSISNMIALAVSGIVGVVLAFKGFAYWAIVIQTLAMVSVLALCYWYYSPWRPTFTWQASPIIRMFPFSCKIMITNVAEGFSTYLFSIVFGRFYTEKEVGYFNQANKWNTMGYSVIRGMVAGVAQPVLVEVNDEQVRQLRIFRKMVRFTAFFSFPAMFGLSFIAPEFITITITDKWAASADLMQILCIGGAFVPISFLFSNLLLSRGNASAYMWSMIGMLAALILTTYFFYPLGITAMVIGYSAINILWMFVWYGLVSKIIGYSFIHFLGDFIPFMGITCVAVAAAFLLTRNIQNIYWLLIAKIFLAAAVYMLIMLLTDSVTFKESIRFILKK